MKKDVGPHAFRPLSEAELQLSANKWSATKVLMFIGGVAALSLGVLTTVYLPRVPQWLNLLLYVTGGVLIARARGLKI